VGCADCHDSEQHEEAIFQGRWYAYPPLRNALIAGLIAGVAFGLTHLGVIDEFVASVLYAVAIMLGGYHWLTEGLAELIGKGRVNIEVLMIAATGGSIALGMWDEAAALVVLYGAAEGLEHYTYVRTRRSIRNLLDLAPKTARLVTDEGEQTAGTLNREGALVVRATTSFEDNTLSRMIHLVEEAQERKGRRQLFIERFGRWYTPAVLISAVLLVVIPALTGTPDIMPWATRAVVLLVAAAPCALIMSTPVGIAAGITRAGRTGVLIKGGAHLEDLGRIRVVAFDKTGTLTEGEPVVTDVVPIDGDEAQLLRLAASLERLSEHPLGEAIVRRAEEQGIQPLQVVDFAAIPGAGVRGKVGDTQIYVGSPRLCEQLGLADVGNDLTRQLEEEGKTVVCVTTTTGPVGLIAIGDRLRDEAPHAVDDLHAMGIHTVILTGDNPGTARAVARQARIDDVRAGLKPEDKIAAVEQIEAERGPVAVVGDGINDAPALARATSGIAMGVGGTDAAIEAADIALIGDDLALVPFAIRLGRRAQAIGTQNIVFALAVLAVMIPAALLGMMSVAVAVLVHEASELLAVANGLRVGSRRSLRCPTGRGTETCRSK